MRHGFEPGVSFCRTHFISHAGKCPKCTAESTGSVPVEGSPATTPTANPITQLNPRMGESTNRGGAP